MNDFIDLQRLVVVVLKRWWLLASMTVLAASIGYSVSQRQPRVYEATTTVLVGQIFQSTNLDRQDILTSELVAQTYSDLTRRQPVLQGVVDILGLSQTWHQLRDQVMVDLVEGTQLIQITVEANSPTLAQQIADEVAHQMILFNPADVDTEENSEVRLFVQQQLASLQTRIESGHSTLASLEQEMVAVDSAERLGELQGEINTLETLITSWENTYTQLLALMQTGQTPNTLTIIEPAQANLKPISPQVHLIVVLGGALGAILALALIFLLEYFNDTYKSPEEITRDFRLPVLGSIRNMGRSKDNSNGVYVSKQPRSPIAESFRLLRANLELISADQPVKTILITSCDKGVGKSTISSNLAIIMAHGERETVLVDADLRNSSVHQIMNLPNDIGLSDILRDELDISEALQWTNGVKGGVITGGALPPNPSELLGSIKMDRVLDRLEGISDVVIIDAPPLFVSDALVLSAKVDGVLLVIRIGQTRRKHVRATLEQLNRVGANLIGVIVNGISEKGDEYYGAYLYSGAGEEKANGQLPAVKNYWSGLLGKFGYAKSGGSNGKPNPEETKELQRALGSSPNGRKPKVIAETGQFCPNESCPDFGTLQSDSQRNITKSGKSKKGIQRYRCKTCGKTFLETIGTMFYRKRTPDEDILETLALIAEGSPISELSQRKGFGQDTIIQWLQEAARHPEQVNEILINEFDVEPDRLDALWESVRLWVGIGAA